MKDQKNINISISSSDIDSIKSLVKSNDLSALSKAISDLIDRSASTHGPSLDEKKLNAYHQRAISIASLSHDAETKVGAVLINRKTGAVMSEGYNGFVRGADDSNIPNTRPDKYEYIIHAEMNLICNAVRHGVHTDEHILYCTMSPCVNCVRFLYQCGIKEMYFKEKYKDFDRSFGMLDLQAVETSVGEYTRLVVSARKAL